MLAAAGNPFSLLTKSTLVLRELDLLVEASRRTDVSVNLSIGTLDPDVWRATEPSTRGCTPPVTSQEVRRRLNRALQRHRGRRVSIRTPATPRTPTRAAVASPPRPRPAPAQLGMPL